MSSTAIQRVLFTAPKVHIYAVPPLTSKGYAASQWTINPPIFMASLRVIETANPSPPQSRPAPPPNSNSSSNIPPDESLTVVVSLEDPSSSALFAEAPYVHPTAVTPCTDSARFFAVRVVGDGGRKATLGIGFEERGEAFDFGIALEDAAKVLGFAKNAAGAGVRGSGRGGVKEVPKRDLSLKEGEMIKIELGGAKAQVQTGDDVVGEEEKKWVAPEGSGMLLPPPPSAAEVRRRMREEHEANDRDESLVGGTTASEQGFDDGEFGEFH